MLKSILIVIVGFFIIVGTLLNADSMHLPILVIMLVAFGVGFTNPQKGWLIVIILIISLLIYGYYFEGLDLEPQKANLIHFICNISFLPILFGGFMGRYFRQIY